MQKIKKLDTDVENVAKRSEELNKTATESSKAAVASALAAKEAADSAVSIADEISRIEINDRGITGDTAEEYKAKAEAAKLTTADAALEASTSAESANIASKLASTKMEELTTKLSDFKSEKDIFEKMSRGSGGGQGEEYSEEINLIYETATELTKKLSEIYKYEKEIAELSKQAESERKKTEKNKDEVDDAKSLIDQFRIDIDKLSEKRAKEQKEQIERDIEATEAGKRHKENVDALRVEAATTKKKTGFGTTNQGLSGNPKSVRVQQLPEKNEVIETKNDNYATVTRSNNNVITPFANSQSRQEKIKERNIRKAAEAAATAKGGRKINKKTMKNYEKKERNNKKSRKNNKKAKHSTRRNKKGSRRII